jgi:RNA polymerase sigma-70 factor (ECF subfamily)
MPLIFPIAIGMMSNPADENKFEQLYEKYRKKVYRICFAILRNEEDAKDSSQDVFLRLAQKISEIDDISAHKTESLVVILSSSIAKNYYKKNKREREQTYSATDEELEAVESAITPDVANSVVAKDGYDRMVAVIQKMSATYKRPLLLKLVEGYSNSEIAEFLELSDVVVRKRISVGKQLLAEELRKEGFTNE